MQISEEEKQSPHFQFAIQVVKQLRSEGFQALWAGGCVRDLLLNKQPGDYDVATSARPEEVQKIFGKKNTFAVGASFGVIILRGRKGADDIEVATFRNDGAYVDGRRPESVVFSSPEEDAERRDFTINGMFYDPIDEKVIDYVGGQNDLKKGIVKAIGNPFNRIQEDKLRMLRAVRFSAKFEFDLDEQTAAAIKKLAPEIHQVSEERITQEWRKMILDSQRVNALKLIESLALLKEIFPELLYDNKTFENHPAWERTCFLFRLIRNYDASFEILIALFFDSLFIAEKTESNDVIYNQQKSVKAEKICKRMKLSNKESEEISWLLLNKNRLDNTPEMELCNLKRTLTCKDFKSLALFSQVISEVDGLDDSSIQFAINYKEKHSEEEINPLPLITGEDLIRIGLKPGPAFKKVLNTIRDAQLNLEITTEAEAIEIAKKVNSN